MKRYVNAALAGLLVRLTTRLDAKNAEKTTATDIQNERHYQNSKPDTFDLEPNLDKVEVEGAAPPIPLTLVLKACPEIALYGSGDIRSWRDLQTAAAFVRGMLGISESAWSDACEQMGGVVAAIAVACILQRFEAIRSPGGYLRALTEEAGQGAFSPGSMVMALLSATPVEAAS